MSHLVEFLCVGQCNLKQKETVHVTPFFVLLPVINYRWTDCSAAIDGVTNSPNTSKCWPHNGWKRTWKWFSRHTTRSQYWLFYALCSAVKYIPHSIQMCFMSQNRVESMASRKYTSSAESWVPSMWPKVYQVIIFLWLYGTFNFAYVRSFLSLIFLSLFFSLWLLCFLCVYCVLCVQRYRKLFRRDNMKAHAKIKHADIKDRYFNHFVHMWPMNVLLKYRRRKNNKICLKKRD